MTVIINEPNLPSWTFLDSSESNTDEDGYTIVAIMNTESSYVIKRTQEMFPKQNKAPFKLIVNDTQSYLYGTLGASIWSAEQMALDELEKKE